MRVAFNVIDETIWFIDRPHEPWTVQAEARAAGRLDDERLRLAVRSALARHPMARARQAPWRFWQTGFTWEITEDAQVDALSIADCPDDAAVARVRSDLYGRPVPLATSPPLRVRLAHHPAGDVILLGVNHAASDGLGTLRLLASIVRAYAGAPDPVPDLDPLAVRDLRAPLALDGLPGRIRHAAALLTELQRPKARIAPERAGDGPGYGFHLVRLDAEDMPALGSRRPPGATVNDVLLAALHLAIAEWNAEHGAPCERIGVMMPVNLRPPERRNEVVGNFSSFVSVATDRADRGRPAATLAAVTAQSRRVKAGGPPGALVDVLATPLPGPLLLKEVTWGLLPFVLERGLDTAVLSNLGRLGEPLSFGADAGDAAEVWFSPPARMPVGLALGAVTIGRWLHLSFRYRHPLFGPGAAARFATRYIDALDRLAA